MNLQREPHPWIEYISVNSNGSIIIFRMQKSKKLSTLPLIFGALNYVRRNTVMCNNFFLWRFYFSWDELFQGRLVSLWIFVYWNKYQRRKFIHHLRGLPLQQLSFCIIENMFKNRISLKKNFYKISADQISADKTTEISSWCRKFCLPLFFFRFWTL